jgi:adenosylcobinamide-GDP ribazoletransferase
MKNAWNGWILSLQFLTVVPLRKEVEWNRETARWSFRFFPLVGILLGGLLAFQHWLFSHFTPVSHLFLSFWLLFFSVFFSGGLHLDGWMDVSDAFFSYRDVKRRQEIMSDSRVGAFAVLSVIFLLSFRFLFMYETIHPHFPSVFFLVVPVLSRGFMALLLAYGQLAKTTGMAAAFREHVVSIDAQIVMASLAVFLVSLIAAEIPLFFHITVLTICTFLFFLWVRSFYEKQFGGITGDTLGAFVEGVETVLWFIIWLLHFFVTV